MIGGGDLGGSGVGGVSVCSPTSCLLGLSHLQFRCFADRAELWKGGVGGCCSLVLKNNSGTSSSVNGPALGGPSPGDRRVRDHAEADCPLSLKTIKLAGPRRDLSLSRARSIQIFIEHLLYTRPGAVGPKTSSGISLFVFSLPNLSASRAPLPSSEPLSRGACFRPAFPTPPFCLLSGCL